MSALYHTPPLLKKPKVDLSSIRYHLRRFTQATKARMGADLTQIAFGTLLIGIISISALVAGNNLVQSQRATQAQQDMQSMVNGIKEQYSMSGNYPNGDLTATLINGGRVPDSRIVGGVIRNNYQGTLTPTGNDINFTVTGTGYSDQACQKIVGAFARMSTATIDDLSVNGTSLALPVDVNAINAACDGSGTNGNDVAITTR